jgi:hypothetical protein
LIRPDIGTAARRFKMDKLCVRRKYDALAVRAKLKAVVHIIEINRKPNLVHSPHLEKVVSPCDQTCSRHSAALMRNAKKITVADVALDAVVKSMCGSKTGAEHNAAMLHDAARPKQQRTDRPHVALYNPAQHLIKPLVIESFDVIVEEAEDVAAGSFGSAIIKAWKIKLTRNT